MKTNLDFTIVVYQFGKVASQSIVSSLNGLGNIECFQSHFLGKEDFNKIINFIIDPRNNDYFSEHKEGQLIKNLRLLRRINTYRQNLCEEGKLIFISTSRDPIEWFRSVVSQNIAGHFPYFKEIAASNNFTFSDKNELIVKVLPHIFDQIYNALKLLKSIDSPDWLCISKEYKQIGIADKKELRHFLQFFKTFVSPHNWFRNHFEQFLGFSISDMREIGSHVYKKESGWCDTYLFRYEDLNVSFPLILNSIGIDSNIQLKTINVSEKKQFSEPIKQTFSDSPILAEIRATAKSSYTDFFGY
ncbi:hypothetical protein [Neosynechococcus sphagnicola]|nr:hypothetical protein [Neosynechococcus sphagnicola]